jgi:hypothetical protein
MYNRHVLAFDIAGVFEALAESSQGVRKRVRCGVEKPDHRHRRLLSTRRERRAAEQREGLPSSHAGPPPCANAGHQKAMALRGWFAAHLAYLGGDGRSLGRSELF